MNTHADAIQESSVPSQAIALIPASRRFYWSVRRELWENRSIYMAPLAVAALFLAGFFISTGHLPSQVRAAAALNAAQQQELFEEPYNFAALLLMGTTGIVALFYCLDALYTERRDRSILFWKSLPVSDLTTVLAKASIPLLILPLLTFAITMVTFWIMLLLSAPVLLATGLGVATVWPHIGLWQISQGLLFHLLAVHALWYAPFYCWWLLVSAWAKRTPFLWAFLPPFAIAVVEKVAFNTMYFARMLTHRFGGEGGQNAPFPVRGMPMDQVAHLHPLMFLVSPGLWSGLAVAAIFLAVAVRLRRYRDPI
jgi:ABC-2 type transport system permease protein